MAKLIKLARSRYPLPLAGLKSEHSLLGLDNLVEAVDRVLAADAPLRRPLIVADPKPLTIGAMIAAMRRGLGRRPALFYVPRPLLRARCARRVSAERSSPCSARWSPTLRRLPGSIGHRASRPRQDSQSFFATRLANDAALQSKRSNFVQRKSAWRNYRKLNLKISCASLAASYHRRILLLWFIMADGGRHLKQGCSP